MVSNIKFETFQISLLLVLWMCTSCNAQTKNTSTHISKNKDAKKTVIQDLCWSPENRYIFFSAMLVAPDFSDYSPDLWTVFRFDTKTNKTQIIKKSALNVAVSPTGEELAVALNVDNSRNIYIIDKNGNNPVPLVTGTSKISAPSWSPDGKQLAYHSYEEGNKEVYTINRDGTDKKKLTNSQGHSAFNPVWSPDGKHIVYYLEKEDKQDQIYIMNSNGTESKNITTDTLHNIFPGWIDDSTIIYGQGHQSSPTRAFQINIDGTNKKQVLRLESMFARYSPDESNIAFINDKEGVITIVTSKGEFLYNIIVPDIWTSNESNSKLVGGLCEGCEAIFEYGDRELTSIDTLPDFNGNGTKIKVTGTIYKTDGKTPANDVILYVYHTDQEGVYATKEDETGWAKRHGYIRGWVKTDKNGQYAFYTLKPGIYPDRSSPAHIHPTILEPNRKYYWLGSYHFEGDSLLTENEINPDSPRGGSSGLLTLKKEGDIWVGKRDFILGKNIPNYE